MNAEGIFWVNIWRTVAAVLITVVVVVALFHHFDNERRTKQWIACVEAGGQPISQPLVGIAGSTFTCIRK